ncbi:hypothetical protein Dsin_019714 [Dipteronia sinensis]|uniref:SWIM-type domain-containing protein n=1 Tax=Dipteronia sinensis TaxID=43782 RepID=A0AAE0A943_9ROSI|nr:hypothetical protein Dsin_019714 [Dipteronia sinensis]
MSQFWRRMDRVRIIISYNSRCEQLADGSLSATCRTFLRNDDDVQFMLREDRVIPQVCVSLTERVAGNVIGNDIPPPENTQQFGSTSGSNQVFTQRSVTEVVDYADVVEPQFGDVFSCRIEMNDGQYNEQYSEMYNEQNTEPNLRPNQRVDNEANIDPEDHVENSDEEPVQTQRRGKCVHVVSCTGTDMPGTSEVRHNVSANDSDNNKMWVIPGADSYSFGIGRSRTLDLKRLVGLFAMRQNFKWKVKRSNKTTLHLVCLIDKCTWKLRGLRRDEMTYFQVRSFVNEHSCPLEEIHRHHRQASSVIIGEVVAPRLQQQDGHLMRPKDIITDTKKCIASTSCTCADDGKFLYFFMSLGASLRGFRRCMHHVIVVDGTHYKGRFGGTMFVATAQDRNEQVYPIAFGYGDSENNLSWEWFLDCLKGVLGHIDDLVFISGRYASIEAGISKVFPYASHTICCWHFAENVKKRFHRKDVASIMDKAAITYTKLKYNWYMGESHNLHKNAFDYVEVVGPHKWSVLVHDRHRAAQSMRHQLTDATHIVILEHVEKCGYIIVNPVDWNIFSVKRSEKQWTVDLDRKTCTCNKFQMDHFPCSYALAAARERNLDFTSLCADYYKRQTLIDAYLVPIMPIGHPSLWVVPSDIAERVVLNPKSKRQSGSPMEGRHASSSERTTTQIV